MISLKNDSWSIPMRAPEDCTTMAEIRAAIDALDHRLVGLLAERARYIDRATQIKRNERLPARITTRVEEVVSNARTAAETAGFDADLTERLWRQLVDWSIAREEETLGTGSPED